PTAAANQYKNNPIAFQLRWMNILYEIGLEGKGTIMMIPMQALEGGQFSEKTLTTLGLKYVQEKSDSNEADSDKPKN
ncbi:MAG: slipin family protein, partial [Candidatus Thermoplasmatota archaeon]|nr:slipin family protein [Candidatus Thermoplasmatota archaeon]